MEFEMGVLASAPIDEPCAQVGTDDYREASMIECYVFRRMLERLFPLPEDCSAYFIIKSFPHDFGAYREVCVKYSGDAGAEYAVKVENELPARWDAVAIQELDWLRERIRYMRAVAAGSITLDAVPELYRLQDPPLFRAKPATPPFWRPEPPSSRSARPTMPDASFVPNPGEE